MRELFVGIVGSRRRNSLSDRKLVFKIVENLVSKFADRKVILVSGACPKGADHFASEAARSFSLEIVEFPVPKQNYESRGQFAQAAFARNKLIADRSDIGFALVSDDRTGGTENTISHFKSQKKKVYVVNENGEVSLIF